ncbi:MAG: ABC transporter ATP-binding protein [Spirochaetia bacterium]|jgi:ABC-2 type transport system ATP-binding protein|nr:ABC transporter ATP-binding protein [Spirochaetia bacterium]
MEPVIQVTELSKTYSHAQKKAVDAVSFCVNEGEFFAFLGPNGAGKTTTISILTTTLAKTSGSVTNAGFDLDRATRQNRGKVVIIFQKPSLDLNLSAEENIRFHACLYGMFPYRPAFSLMSRAYKDRVMELAEIVGLKDSLRQPIKKMSGGMQRKLEIIRSLIHQPDILFLDEPTQGLDAVSRRNLWEYINRTRKELGTTVFLTTHYIDEAENVDTVCIINQGKIEFTGSPEQMKETLLRRELLLDAADRAALEDELKSMSVGYTIGKHIVVPTAGGVSAQKIISGLKTPLSYLNTHEPSLEDAYVELIGQKEGTAAMKRGSMFDFTARSARERLA